MSSSPSFGELFRRVYVQRAAAHFPAVERCREALPDAPFALVDDHSGIPEEFRSRTSLYLSTPRGQVFGRCPGTRGHLCCNYTTLDLYLGCTLDCTYCIMRSYLNFAPVTVYVDPRPGIEAVLAAATVQPDRTVRVGTGEVGDSLLLDPMFRLSQEYITAFSSVPNIVFEMKTKTTSVDHLLDVEPKGNAVIGFSLSARSAARAEDGSAATIDERLDAAARASAAGYSLAFHFDPIIATEQWEEEVAEVADDLARFAGSRVAWISMGTIRYPQALREHMADRPYLYDEFVPGRDGKFRYLQRRRIAMYRYLRERLSRAVDAPIYMCMESAAVWNGVYGSGPLGCDTGVRRLFEPLSGISDRRADS